MEHYYLLTMIIFAVLFAILFMLYFRKPKNEINKDEENKTLTDTIKNKDTVISKLQKQISELNSEREELQKAYDNIKNILEDSKITDNPDVSNEIQPEEMQLDEEQNAVYKLMCSDNNLFVSGKAGTGKSFLLRYFRTHTTKIALYTAPTGIAAITINGSTLHSVFGFDNLLYGKRNYPELSENQTALFKKIDSLVIDEISMVSSGLFERLDFILKIARNNEKPFGGVQVIVFGDLFQLPPVIKSKVIATALTDRFGGVYFFNSFAYKNGNFTFCELTIPHRQEADLKFLTMLDNIRIGNVSTEIVEQLNKRCYSYQGIEDFQEFCFSKRIVQLVSTNNQAEFITNQALKKITKEKMYTYKAINIEIDESVYDNVEKFYKDVSAPEKLSLKVGALVMMTKNDTDNKRWVNGTMGVVSHLTENSVSVAINEVIFQLTQEKFEVTKAEYDEQTGKINYRSVGSMFQFPLIPAYAITIHKAQGQTYSRLACDVSKCFASGQTYVALSRCKTLDELYLANPLKSGAIKTDNNVINFYNSLIKHDFF